MRLRAYLLLGAVLMVGRLLAGRAAWASPPELHTLIEAVAAVVAAVVASIALVRFYAKRHTSFLFLATAFLGVALLDGYHAVVTASWFVDSWPSTPPSLIAWSWTASRVYLPVMLLAGCLTRRVRGDQKPFAGESAAGIYLVAGGLTIAAALLFALVPLPDAYAQTGAVGRPWELLSAALFLAALVGHLRRGLWRGETLESWIVISIVLGFACQGLYMPFSRTLFDPLFDLAHAIKALSYLAILIGMLFSLRELIERERDAVHQARFSQAQFQGLFNSVPDGVYRSNPEGELLMANTALVRMLGFDTEEELVAVDLESVYAQPAARDAWMRQVEDSGELRSAELELRRRDGETLTVLDSVRAVRGDEGEILYYEGTITDITDRKRAEDRLAYLANYDSLTGLVNRRHFEERFAQALAEARRYGSQCGLIWLDVDRFKEVNDAFGHHAGDELLCRVGNELKRRLRDVDVVARLGGDEFAVILPHTDSAGADVVAQRLLASVRELAVVVRGRTVRVTLSLGVAGFPEHGRTAEELLGLADQALYQAKEAGRDRVRAYSAGEQPRPGGASRVSWGAELRRALDEERLVAHAQPIRHVESGRISSYELLVRILDDDGNLVLPGTFIHAAERFGYVRQIDQWMTERCLGLLESAELGAEAVLHVNVSSQSLEDARLLSLIRAAAERRLPLERLVFEVTEAAAIANVQGIQDAMKALRELGCRFALDDFGVGFSSFYHLKHLPVDFLKIDGSFVEQLASSPVDRRLVPVIAQLGQSLGMQTVAEFVGDEESLWLLGQFGVDYAQGYFIGRPSPIPALVKA